MDDDDDDDDSDDRQTYGSVGCRKSTAQKKGTGKLKDESVEQT